MLLINPEIIRTPTVDEGILLLEPVAGKYYELNDTSALIYQCLEQESDLNTITQMLINSFDIDEQTAITDIQNLIAEFLENNICIDTQIST